MAQSLEMKDKIVIEMICLGAFIGTVFLAVGFEMVVKFASNYNPEHAMIGGLLALLIWSPVRKYLQSHWRKTK